MIAVMRFECELRLYGPFGATRLMYAAAGRQGPPVRLSVNLDRTDHPVLDRLVERNDVFVAWLVRQAVNEFVDQMSQSVQGELPFPRGRQDREASPV